MSDTTSGTSSIHSAAPSENHMKLNSVDALERRKKAGPNQPEDKYSQFPR